MARELVFVVDDDEFIQRLLKDTLEQEGYRTIIAISAEECYRQLGSQIPDLFVLDIMLPGQDGFQLCRNLRKQSITERIPILMLSSKSKVQDRVIGLEAGADDYLVKPFHLDELIARIRALLRRSLPSSWEKTGQAPSAPVDTGKPQAVSPERQKSAGTSSQKDVPASSAAGGTRPAIAQPDKKTADKPVNGIRTPVRKVVPEPLIDDNADFDTRKKMATEFYQQRFYDKALQLFESLAIEAPRDLYVKKYLEVTKTSMMKHFMSALVSKDAVPVRTSDRPEDFIGLDFNTQEGFIFSQIDGITDFKGIVAISGMKPLTAYGILFNLFHSGVIKIKG